MPDANYVNSTGGITRKPQMVDLQTCVLSPKMAFNTGLSLGTFLFDEINGEVWLTDRVIDSSYCNKQPECVGGCMENLVPGWWDNTGEAQ